MCDFAKNEKKQFLEILSFDHNKSEEFVAN